MKNIVSVLALSSALLVAVPVAACATDSSAAKVEKKAKKAYEKVVFDTYMHCHSCQKKLSENLAFEKGVKGLDVNLEAQTITFTYDPAKTDAEKLAAAVRKLGYKAERKQ